jgi:hypothetical protein
VIQLQQDGATPNGGKILSYYSKNSADIYQHNTHLLQTLWQQKIVARMDQNAPNKFTSLASLKEEGVKLLAEYDAKVWGGGKNVAEN